MDVQRKNFCIFYFFVLASAILLFPPPLAAQKNPLQLEPLIRTALENNPSILAARNEWQSAQAIIEARGSLPDPQLSYTEFIESIETRVGPQERIVGINQKFPFFGKRRLQSEVAANEADRLEAIYYAVRQEVISEVKKTFYQLYYLNRIIEITRQEKELLRRMENIALTAYETGGGHQQNVLKVQVAQTNLEEKLLNLKTLRKTTEEMLNKRLGIPSARPVGSPERPEFQPLQMTKDELLRLAVDQRPELRARFAAIGKSRENLQLAKKEYFPDVTVGFNYTQVDDGPLNVSDNGQDSYNATLSLNLPIWRNKLSSQVKSAAENVAMQKSQYQDTLNQVLFQVEDNYFKARNAAKTVSLYQQALIPQARQSLESAEAGYQTGSLGFLDFLDAERTLLKIHYGYWKVYTDYLKYLAALEKAVGGPLAK
jgi:outer membrane protein TolC